MLNELAKTRSQVNSTAGRNSSLLTMPLQFSRAAQRNSTGEMVIDSFKSFNSKFEFFHKAPDSNGKISLRTASVSKRSAWLRDITAG